MHIDDWWAEEALRDHASGGDPRVVNGGKIRAPVLKDYLLRSGPELRLAGVTVCNELGDLRGVQLRPLSMESCTFEVQSEFRPTTSVTTSTTPSTTRNPSSGR